MVAGAWKETPEKENHAQTTAIMIQPEKPLSLHLADL